MRGITLYLDFGPTAGGGSAAAAGCRGRALAARCLSLHLCGESRQWRFERSAAGKLDLHPAGGGAHRISLSYTDGMSVCAVSEVGAVGVDIEYRRPERDVARLARRYYAPVEKRWLERLSSRRRREGFYDLWCLKEAAVKAEGGSLAAALATRRFTFGGGEFPVRAGESPWRYRLLSDRLAAFVGNRNFSLALCFAPGGVGDSAGKDIPVQLERFGERIR